jgi:hypothetical protein
LRIVVKLFIMSLSVKEKRRNNQEKEGNKMAAELQSPVCKATGLPLPILPTEPDARALFIFEDYHHHFHPRNSPELKEIEGRAVRYSRGQMIGRFLHDRYHQLFLGPPLPETLDEKFRVAVMACAGVVPRQALDLSTPGEYKVVNLTNDQYERLTDPHSIHVDRAFHPEQSFYKRRTIGKFFASYAMQQNVRLAVSDNVIEQFLDVQATPERKKELGNLILREALGMSVESLAPLHRGLQEEGYVAPRKQLPLFSVVRKYFTKEYFQDYHDEIAKRLVIPNTLQTEVNTLELAG